MPTRVDHNGRLVALDGLRGIAVFIILVNHFVLWTMWAAPTDAGTWRSYLAVGLGLSFSGVDLFFVLSGYLIGGILLDQREAPNFFGVFYARRAFRILPLYYVFLTICWLLASTLLGLAKTTYPLWSYTIFLNNLFAAVAGAWDQGQPSLAWSLAVEEQFYLFFPLLVRFCSSRHLRTLTAATLVVAPLLRGATILAVPQYSLATHLFTLFRMDSLAFGVLIALAVRDPKLRAWLTSHPRAPGTAALALIPALELLTYTRTTLQTLPMALVGYTALGAFYAALLACVVGGHPRWLVRVCEVRPLVFLGRISYFVYLFQGVAGWLVFYWFKGAGRVTLSSWTDAGLIALALTLLMLTGAVSWGIFESKLVSVGHRFRYASAPLSSVT